MAYITITGNVAEVRDFPRDGSRDISISVKAKTNSSRIQKITVAGSGTADFVFQGSGERNTIIGETSFTASSGVTVKFEYLAGDGTVSNSTLNSGGPYQIGSYNLLVIVAENGDDSDFNDAIIEFSWRTPK
jgi:hypothetical protein